ncbi:MAG: SMI1/KNR4 family protein [Myxococcota bacterium]|nr:SMI1/KNR4 family protein [Myxococcota bacterium]
MQIKSEGAPVTELELECLRDAIGSEPPSDYVGFLSSRNGCRVDVGRVIAEKAALGGQLSRHAWPVADAEGGNYVCLRREEAGVWCIVFWDHELETETVLSSTFSAFLESLEKFDPASVELKPGQVISAWIDPSLLTEDEE